MFESILVSMNIIACAYILYSALREKRINVDIDGKRFECAINRCGITVKVNNS